MDKKMRKRMAMIKNEQNRVYTTQYAAISSTKSFDEIKDEREATLERSYDSSDDQRDRTCDSPNPTDHINELRRRRIYESTYRRRYPAKSMKKKPTFWNLEEELTRPAVLLSSSFSDLNRQLQT